MNRYDDLPYRDTILRAGGINAAAGEIAHRLQSAGLLVIAIDGDSASGKSTLAAALTDRFGGGIIHIDDFFLPSGLRTKERLSLPGGNVHHERFIDEVLPKLRDPAPFGYRTFDCSVMDFGPERIVDAGPLRIVEGAYSLHPVFRRYFDLSLLLSVDPETQSQRILSRNGALAAERFFRTWIPMEKEYQRYYSIPESADMILRVP